MQHDFEALAQALSQDPFASRNGIELEELRLGYARTSLRVGPEHRNSFGLTHGGAIFTLAACALAAAANTHGRLAVGVNLHVSFLKATRSGRLRAEANEVARSKRLSTCSVRVTNDAGHLIALLEGTAYIKDEPFPPEGRNA